MMKLEIPNEPILTCFQNAPPTSHNALLETKDENNLMTDMSFESGVISGDPATQVLNVVVFIIIGGEYTMHMVTQNDLSTLSQSDNMQLLFSHRFEPMLDYSLGSTSRYKLGF